MEKGKKWGGGGSIKGILGSKLYKRGLTFFKELGDHFLGSTRCLINKNIVCFCIEGETSLKRLEWFEGLERC